MLPSQKKVIRLRGDYSRDTFVPSLDLVMNIHTQILSIFENAKCNEKICMISSDRVEIAQTAVKSLRRKYQLMDVMKDEINVEIRLAITEVTMLKSKQTISIYK
ncbi:14848_t:CDS:2 [Dentiscutata erythropus]|uniref:14848_t:CDS:1 n=1 Tax=Dentiscutata erythropus TaxID=1348616 RepID=A0A9N9CXZ1_9GLOM|nr:14848_t:CDS:2 [Dentiscutata erythropus]